MSDEFFPRELDKDYLRGVELMSDGKYKKAIQLFDKVVARNSESANGGAAKTLGGHRDFLAAAFNSRLGEPRCYPDHIAALHKRSICYGELQLYEITLRDEFALLSKAPDFMYAYGALGSAWGRLARQVETAKDEGKTIPVTYPQISAVLNSKKFYDAEECWQHAFNYLEKAVNFDPNDFDSVWERGLFYFHKENFAKAREDLRKVSLNDPENLDVLIWYADACLNLDAAEEAIECCERGKAADPAILDFYEIKGYALQQLKRYAEAEKEFLHALKIAPKNAAIRTKLNELKKAVASASPES